MRRASITGTLSLLCCLSHSSSASSTSLRSCFRHSFILDPFCCFTLIILVEFFQVLWIVEITRRNFGHTSVALPPPFSICSTSIILIFPSAVKCFQSPVICNGQRQKSRRQPQTQGELRCNCHFPGLEFIIVQFVHSSMIGQQSSQNRLHLGKLYWNRRMVMSLYPMQMLLCMSYYPRQKNTCVMWNQLVPQNVRLCTRSIAETEVVITEFICTLLLAEALEMRRSFQFIPLATTGLNAKQLHLCSGKL